MYSVVNYNDDIELNPEVKSIVIVKSADEIIKLRSAFPNEKIKIRAIFQSIDEELLSLLTSLNEDFEIILQSNNIKERDMILLNKYKTETENKVYVAYDVDSDSPYDRAILIYYINRYGVIALLNAKDETLYRTWVSEMTKYTERKNVKKLSRTYIGKQS